MVNTLLSRRSSKGIRRSFKGIGFKRNSRPASLEYSSSYTRNSFDDKTGLQNNINRWYEPATGKWISEDPIEFDGGDENLYRYVRNQATIGTDPSGHRIARCKKSVPGGSETTPTTFTEFVKVPDSFNGDPCSVIFGIGWYETPLTPDELAISQCCDTACEKELADLMQHVSNTSMPNGNNKCHDWMAAFLKNYPQYNPSTGKISLCDGKIIIEPLTVPANPDAIDPKWKCVPTYWSLGACLLGDYGWGPSGFTDHAIVRVTFYPSGKVGYFDLGTGTELGQFGGDDRWWTLVSNRDCACLLDLKKGKPWYPQAK